MRAGVYRPSHTEPAITCLVLDGADLTVSEPSCGKIRFAKFQELDSSVFRTKETTNHFETGANV